MNIEKMREEFEAWIRVRSADTPMGFYPKLLHRCTLDEDIYRISWVDSAWEGWQASRELLAIELPKIRDIDESMDCIDSAEFAVSECAVAIEAAGLKVKS